MDAAVVGSPYWSAYHTCYFSDCMPEILHSGA
jgi:hypothetical protein